MADNLITTKDLEDKRVVVGPKAKRVGKVHYFVFHPTRKRALGFTVKRPDAALMFKRADAFVALGAYTVDENGQIACEGDRLPSGKDACQGLGVDYDACVLWVGMPVITESGDMLGYIESVTFDAESGDVFDITTENGATADVLLGKRCIPASLIKGFRIGQGMALAPMGQYGGEEESADVVRGCILVSDEAADASVTGGLAAKAGQATAVATHKAKQGVEQAKTKARVVANKASEAVSTATETAKPVVQSAAKKTGEAVDKGAFSVGRQLGRATGMFSAFKNEFDKALKDEGEDD